MIKKLETKLRSLDACEEGIAEAMKYSNPHEAWKNVGDRNLLQLFLKIADDKSKDLFSIWAARQVQHLMTDPRSISALDVKEKWLKGEATDKELKIAREAARAAAYADASAVAAAYYAAAADAYAVASAARAAQAAWIRENFTPDFEKLLG